MVNQVKRLQKAKQQVQNLRESLDGILKSLEVKEKILKDERVDGASAGRMLKPVADALARLAKMDGDLEKLADRLAT
jgi:hypothetical protein